MIASRCLAPPVSGRACFNCSAWSAYSDIAVGRETEDHGYVILGRMPLGQCRAATPVIDPGAVGSETAAWPVVQADSWCRQFEAVRPHERGEAAR